jgi:hypothetical protein
MGMVWFNAVEHDLESSNLTSGSGISAPGTHLVHFLTYSNDEVDNTQTNLKQEEEVLFRRGG